DWSSDVCSSDLEAPSRRDGGSARRCSTEELSRFRHGGRSALAIVSIAHYSGVTCRPPPPPLAPPMPPASCPSSWHWCARSSPAWPPDAPRWARSEEHT